MAGAAFVTDVTEIATQAAEAAAGIGAAVSALKMIELQRKYYDLYKQQRDFYYNTFQVGVETPLATQTYLDPAYTMNYAGRIETAYDTSVGPFGGASTDGLGWWTRHAAAYSSSPDSNMQLEYAVELAKIKTDWTNYLLRFEEHFFDVTNDRRWEKRLSVHNIGIKQGTAIAASLDSSLSGYAGNIADLGSQLATYGNGIAKYVGYKKGLADTSDDFTAMGYDRYDNYTPNTTYKSGVGYGNLK